MPGRGDPSQFVKTLPGPLFILIAGLVAIPLCGFEVMHQARLEWNVLHIATYFILPLASILFIINRAIWFLPTYFCNMVLLGYLAWQTYPPDSYRLPVVVGIIAVALLLGLAISTKNVLAPFLDKNKRHWRIHKRLRGNKPITLHVGTRKIALLTEDAAHSGLRIYGALEDFGCDVVQKGQKLKLSYRVGIKEQYVSVVVRWTEDISPFVRFGVEFLGEPSTNRGIINLVRFPATRWLHHVNRYWAISAWRWTIVALWLSSMGVSMGIPACGSGGTEEKRRDVVIKTQIDGQFALTSPGSVSLNVQGCLSGHAEQLTYPMENFRLYANDRDCVMIVSNVVLGSEIYVIQSGYAFDPRVGAITPFVGTSGNVLYILVTGQLPSLLDGSTATVGFQFHSTHIGNGAVVTSPKNIISVEILTPEVTEGGSVQVRFYKVSDISQEAFDLFYTISGNATPVSGSPAEGDYYAPPNPLIFPAHASELIINIATLDDNLAEADKTFQISLSNSEHYFHFGQATAFIKDNDANIITEGLVGWFHPESFYTNSSQQITTGGESVAVWADASQLAVPHNASVLGSVTTTSGVGSHLGIEFTANSLLAVANSELINSAGPYPQKTLVTVFATSGDITSRQVIYEEGGSTKGYNLYIEGGLLYFNTWDVNASLMAFVSSPISPNTSYLASLQIDATVDVLRAYVLGQLVATSTGVPTLHRHRDNTAIGGVRGSTRFHTGETTGAISFTGKMSELLLFSYDTQNQIDASSFTQELLAAHQAILNKYGFDKPVLSLTADVGMLDEKSESTAYVTISRQNVSASSLDISYEISGTATNGVDFTWLPGSISIPAYATSVTFPVVAIDDNITEGHETLTLTIMPSSSYSIAIGSQTVVILDDEAFTPPTGISAWFDAGQGVSGTSVSSWSELGGTHVARQNSNPKRPRLITDQQSGLAAIQFDGKDDYLTIQSHSELDSGGPYNKKTIALAFKTFNDVTSRQTIYEQGDTNRGMSVGIHQGRLYFTVWNKNENAWGPISISTPISPQTSYSTIVEFDRIAQKLRVYQSDQPVMEVSNAAINDLYAHGGGIGIGGPQGRTIWHDGSATGNSYFSGMIFELMLFNNILGEAGSVYVIRYLEDKYGG